MPRGRTKNKSVSNGVDTNLVTTAETVIATLNGVTTSSPDESVFITGHAVILAGASATGVSLKLRRGTTPAGTQIGEAEIATVAAATTVIGMIAAGDSPGEVAGQSYVLTAQQVAATGNGTSTFATLTSVAPG